MPQDPFPSPERDGEEPGRPVPSAPGDLDGAEGPEQGLFVCLPAEELTLAGFAQDGRADTMAPGALLAALLEAITGEGGSGLAGLADDQLIGIISAARRMESRTAWTLLAALAELARRRPATEPADSGEAGFSDFAADEVAAELHLTGQSATDQIWYACTVADRLPRSFAALAAGRLHPVHLRIVQDETSDPDPGTGRRGRRASWPGPRSPRRSGELRYAAHRLILKLDPDAARKRKEAAAKHEAEVRRFREDSGNAGMIARELPPDEVLASWQHVDQRAHDLRAAGMPGTLRELRIQAYLDLLQERDSRDAAGEPSAGQADRPAGPDGPGGGGPGGGGPGPQPDGPVGNGGPGSGPDGGPGRQSAARDPAPQPGRPAAELARRTARAAGTDPDGRARRGDGPSVAALVNITVPLATVLGLIADAGGSRRVRNAGRRRRPRPGGRRGPAPGHPMVRDRAVPRRHRRRARLRSRPPPAATLTRPRQPRRHQRRSARPGSAARYRQPT